MLKQQRLNQAKGRITCLGADFVACNVVAVDCHYAFNCDLQKVLYIWENN
jgi:hypothetical protein